MKKVPLNEKKEGCIKSNHRVVYRLKNDLPRFLSSYRLYGGFEHKELCNFKHDTFEQDKDGISVVIDDLERKTLPMISGDDDYRKRIEKYEDGKECRKTEFFRRTICGFVISRKMYSEAYKQLQFWENGEEAVLEKVSNVFLSRKYKDFMKKIVVCLRKIAESCYYLDRFEEAMEICQNIIKLVDAHRMNRKMLKLTYAVMGRIMIVKKDLKKAGEFIVKGLELDPSSGMLQRAEEYLEKTERSEFYESFRIKARNKIISYEVFEKEFDDLLSERISFLNESRDWCDDLDKSHFQIQLTNKNICFCKIYFL